MGMKVSLNSGTKKSRNAHAKHLDEIYENAYKIEACMGKQYTFEENEMLFFKQTFHDEYMAQQERYRKKGNTKRLKNEDDYMQNLIDEHVHEQIYQIGDMENNLGNQNMQILWTYFSRARREMDDNLGLKRVTLDSALHLDLDEATPHVHERSVYLSIDKNGKLTCDFSKALRSAGINRPNPAKKEDRYNNPMITYTDMCRDLFLQVSREFIKKHEIDAEIDDIDHSNRGKHLKGRTAREYTKDKIRETEECIQEAVSEWVAELNGREKKLDEREKGFDEREKELDEREKFLNDYARELIAKEDSINEKLEENKKVLERLEKFEKKKHNQKQSIINQRMFGQ